jgi:hypothetical protein
VSEPYTTNTTEVTYYLNTTRSNFTYAENMCARNGGHLASFTSSAEQLEVEQYYAGRGYLFPSYHVFYWTGLVVRLLSRGRSQRIARRTILVADLHPLCCSRPQQITAAAGRGSDWGKPGHT